MATLMFECPASGAEVSTGIELDESSFKNLSRQTTYVHCPHCRAPHLLGSVRAWLERAMAVMGERVPMHLV